eukprot:700552-Pleurochrysis_carterae.AAC.2
MAKEREKSDARRQRKLVVKGNVTNGGSELEESSEPYSCVLLVGALGRQRRPISGDLLRGCARAARVARVAREPPQSFSREGGAATFQRQERMEEGGATLLLIVVDPSEDRFPPQE